MDKTKVRKLHVKSKKICGFGINDADYPTQGKSGACPAYRRWVSMISRAYGDYKSHSRLGVCYQDASVSDEWRYFTDFKKWFDENSVEGWSLDKDLLTPDNKEYGPDNCIFIPHNVNTAITVTRKTVWNTLPGVAYRPKEKAGRFVAAVPLVNGTYPQRGFSDEYAANEHYRKAKAKELFYLIANGDYGSRIDDALLMHRYMLLNPKKDSRYVLRRSLGKPIPEQHKKRVY